jgi:hypothetical protein
MSEMTETRLKPGSTESSHYCDYVYEYGPKDTIPTPLGTKKVFLADLSKIGDDVQVVIFMGVYDPKSERGRWATFSGTMRNFERVWNGRMHAVRFEMVSNLKYGNDRVVWEWTARPDMWAYVPTGTVLPEKG